MANVSKWDVLDACSHRDWKFPANLARELSISIAAHITIAQVFVSLEVLEDSGHIESKEDGNRRSFRKTAEGMQARQRSRQSEATQSPKTGLKPV